ncbi:origin recognition complex subunit 5 isoform X2 [Cherax quadricarinatus]|uniref:origin recognition complex subunit 5 isoform X2 n=1 Tax=Cherax quadricarinatus TaxID=27406 RepID=UPI00387E3E4D
MPTFCLCYVGYRSLPRISILLSSSYHHCLLKSFVLLLDSWSLLSSIFLSILKEKLQKAVSSWHHHQHNIGTTISRTLAPPSAEHWHHHQQNIGTTISRTLAPPSAEHWHHHQQNIGTTISRTLAPPSAEHWHHHQQNIGTTISRTLAPPSAEHWHHHQQNIDELVDILLKQRPSSHSVEFYKNYIKLVLSVFYLATKGLPELKHQVQLHFKAYCEPLEKGEADEHDIRLLWRNIEPQLKKSMSSVYLREVSSAQYERMQQLTETAPTDQSHFKSALTNKMELPYYTKFLLIAAYLASYNPARTDRRFFMKHHGKQRKTQAMIKAKERSSSQLVGPKPFPLDRLLAIFYSIIDDKVTPTANIFSQISTLVTLRLVTQIGGNDQLDSPKYKCAVTLDFIRNVARMVSFDVVRYLYDYA